MDEPRWTALLSRIVPQDADDIDDLTRVHDARATEAGNDLFPDIAAALHCENAFKRPDTVCVGLRVSAPLADTCDRALRLASLAAEQNVEVVVLSEIDVTGFERFGFRIERIAPGQDAPGFGQQVKRFWGIDLVL